MSQITSGGGSCGDFTPGSTITGSYSASDNEQLDGVSISVEMPMPGATLTQTLLHRVTDQPVGHLEPRDTPDHRTVWLHDHRRRC